jgi:menaquinone-dependent protoporphyrinogen oxidase
MTPQILITYATRAGSTAEIASEIGQTLEKNGLNVEIKPVRQVASLSGYQTVLLGSPIRMGSWLPEMVKFIQAHQAALNALPTALFTVHMLNVGEDESSRTARTAYVAPVRTLLPNAQQAFFTGRMDFSRLSLLDRFIAKMVKAVESDQRDWNAIQQWAQTLSLQIIAKNIL